MHMIYVMGLGNPGSQYEGTRHNIGRASVERLAARASAEWTRDKQANALLATASVGGTPATLALPETYMNRSGETAAYFTRAHGAAPEDIIVMYDDIDLPLGTVRIGKDRGDGGHNGIKSITSALKSKAFVRVRIGIAPTSFWTGKVKRPAGGGALERFVLSRFSRRERQTAEIAIDRACAAVDAIAADGVDRAMNAFNRS